MSLKDEIILNSSDKKKRSLDKIFELLSSEDSKELEELLSDENIDASAIARALRSRGFAISDRAVQRYRRDFNEELVRRDI